MVTDPRSDLAPAAPPLWKNPRFHAVLFQLVVIAAVLAFFVYIVHNTLHNMEQRGIQAGFSFLGHEAGFGIIQSLIQYSPASTYGRTFIVGLLNTLLVSAVGIVLATGVGLIIGIARLSRNWLIARLATVYIEIFRNIPLLLQILFWYFAVLQILPSPRRSLSIGDDVFLNIRGLYLPRPLPGPDFGWVLVALAVAIVAVIFLARRAHKRQMATGKHLPVFWLSAALIVLLPLIAFFAAGSPLSWSYPKLTGFNFQGGTKLLPEFIALVLALTLYTASSIAEIVRSGIMAVSHGQTEAAYALGIRSGLTTRLVILPQAMRVIIPPLTSQYLNLTKNSSLATAIGYPDLVSVFAGTTLNQTGNAVEIIAMTMSVYLVISLLISLLMNWYNRKMALVER